MLKPYLLAIFALSSIGHSHEAEDESKKTVLITGGAGFIGHHVIEVIIPQAMDSSVFQSF